MNAGFYSTNKESNRENYFEIQLFGAVFEGPFEIGNTGKTQMGCCTG